MVARPVLAAVSRSRATCPDARCSVNYSSDAPDAHHATRDLRDVRVIAPRLADARVFQRERLDWLGTHRLTNEHGSAARRGAGMEDARAEIDASDRISMPLAEQARRSKSRRLDRVWGGRR